MSQQQYSVKWVSQLTVQLTELGATGRKWRCGVNVAFLLLSTCAGLQLALST